MPRPPTPVRSKDTLFSVLIGLCALDVLLQGVWAGIFLEHDGGRDAAASWIEVHARGADVAILLAVLATAVAFWRLRPRRDLWLSSAALTVVLIVEAYIGGLIHDDSKDVLTAVHVPLAMALMGLVVWIPLRARSGRGSAESNAVAYDGGATVWTKARSAAR